VSVLEDDFRDDLNKSFLLKNVVLDTIRLSIKYMPNHHLDVTNHPQDPEFGRREITIYSQILIERDDFVFKLEKDLKKLSPN
ncbi:glutamine--tRNA ligase, partial [Francisella tularensis subsp. holarctica]|nr:glutamine--tRNA ligase [Francisella tularensis subsp. holarctica]